MHLKTFKVTYAPLARGTVKTFCIVTDVPADAEYQAGKLMQRMAERLGDYAKPLIQEQPDESFPTRNPAVLQPAGLAH